VEEVNVETVDVSHQRIERVQPRFGSAPVVSVMPVLDERLHPQQRSALAPIVHCFPLRPSCAAKPLSKVVESALGERERVRPNGVGHHDFPGI
jgi:hypothetical protein